MNKIEKDYYDGLFKHRQEVQDIYNEPMVSPFFCITLIIFLFVFSVAVILLNL